MAFFCKEYRTNSFVLPSYLIRMHEIVSPVFAIKQQLISVFYIRVESMHLTEMNAYEDMAKETKGSYHILLSYI